MAVLDKDVQGQRGPQGRRLMLRFVLLTGLAIGLVGVSALIQELQAASTAWIVGQSHWSRAQQRAVSALERYVDSADPADLQEARQALAVPLGDLRARQVMDREPFDRAAARAGLRQGRNAPASIERLILSYRHGSELWYFREAVALWKATDGPLLELAALADSLERRLARGGLDRAERADLRARLQRLDAQLQALAHAFSNALVRTAERIRLTTLLAGMVSALVIILVAVLLARRVRRELREEESRFRAAFYQASVGMLKLDGGGRLKEANEALAGLLQRPRRQLLHMHLRELLVEGELVHDAGGGIDWSQQARPGELRFVRGDGSLMWGRWSCTVVPGDKGGMSVFAIVEDVTENHVLAREVQHHANHDPLTGLVNRREVERLLDLALLQVRQYGGPHALCCINLDHFKLVNDTVGHTAGDRMLRAVSGQLTQAVREGDWVGRLGGDEFALFLADVSQAEARRAVQRIMRDLGQAPEAFADGLPRLGCSVGIVEVNAEAPDVSWLLGAADSACYAAKQAGRNRIHCYNEDRLALEDRRAEAERLRVASQAISEGRMVLHAQRIARVGDPDHVHYEVLVRMRDRDGTLQGPAAFIGAVERYGMGMALDRCVLSLLFKHLQSCPAHVRQLHLCNVNVSAQSIADPSFLAHVVDLLERNRALAHRLCFEITETAVISNLAQARGFIDAVKARGCRIALDDFGSGMSSFGYLRQLPADQLKIDGSFVRDMLDDPVSRAAVGAIAGLGRELGMEVVAEWVETAEVASQLVQLGVSGLQGHAIARPVPLEELTRDLLQAQAASAAPDAADRR